MDKGACGLQSMGSQKSQIRLSTHLPQPHVYLILVNVFSFLLLFFPLGNLKESFKGHSEIS